DFHVTGVQTCALPIWLYSLGRFADSGLFGQERLENLGSLSGDHPALQRRLLSGQDVPSPILTMSNRIYNILFHTHTVSGLVISVGLYVIFFAGSFSFFRDEMVGWERNESLVESDFQDIDLNVMMDSLNGRQENYGRDISFSKYYEDRRINVNLSASKDTTAIPDEKKGRRGKFFYMNVDDYKTYDYASNYSIGEFLYRLHFLAQLNLYGRSGYLIAGIISFFFLFAIVTGVLVHWKKIISNFYLFRPRA